MDFPLTAVKIHPLNIVAITPKHVHLINYYININLLTLPDEGIILKSILRQSYFWIALLHYFTQVHISYYW